MSLSPSCLSTAGTARADRLEWPCLGPLRWPYLAFAREELLLHREPAVCLTAEGVYWEYDGRRFLSHGRRRRYVAQARRRPG